MQVDAPAANAAPMALEGRIHLRFTLFMLIQRL